MVVKHSAIYELYGRIVISFYSDNLMTGELNILFPELNILPFKKF